jgi:hypothetical protein
VRQPPSLSPAPHAVCKDGYGGVAGTDAATKSGCAICPAGSYGKQLTLKVGVGGGEWGVGGVGARWLHGAPPLTLDC